MSDEAEQIFNKDLKTLDSTPPWEWPENAADTLLDILRSRKDVESDRLLAAEFAGDYVVVNDEIVDVLLALLQNPEESEAIRAQAAISLGPVLEACDCDGFEDPDDVPISEETFQKIVEVLPRAYADESAPKLVRRRVLEAAVRAPREWLRPIVQEAYASKDEEWKLTAVFCMAHMEGFEAQILESLNSDDSEIVYEAVQGAGNWQLKAAWSHVVGLLESDATDKPTLLVALEAAAAIKPKEAQKLLLKFMDSDDEEIAEAASEAMELAQAIVGAEEL